MFTSDLADQLVAEQESTCNATLAIQNVGLALDPPERTALINQILDRSNCPAGVLEAAVMFARLWGDATTVKILHRMVASATSDGLREVAIDSLVALCGVAAIPTLAEDLYGPSLPRQVAAMKAAKRLPRHSAIEILRQAMVTHPAEELRYIAALYLAYLGLPDGRSLLQQHLAQSRSEVFDKESKTAAILCALSFLGDRDALIRLLPLVTTLGVSNDLPQRLVLSILRNLLELQGIDDGTVQSTVVSWIEEQLRTQQDSEEQR